ncbi:MAG: porin [bacterium JZ-2024 1]
MRSLYGVAVLLGVLGLAVFARSSQAITAFARKYNQPCVTCHSPAPPRLNDFGRDFKENGYYMEGGREFTPVETLNISELPPISVRVLSWLVQHSKNLTNNTVKFTIPDEVEVMVADSFGPKLYGFAEVEIEDGEANSGLTVAGHSLSPDGRIWLRAGNFPADEWVSLNLGAGDFRLTRQRYLFENFDFISGVPPLGGESTGFAVYGRPSEPFWFDIAILEGDKTNKNKDIWGHINYTFSGNWNLSLFGYSGKYGSTPKLDFSRLGVGIRWNAPAVSVYASFLSNSYDQSGGGSKDGTIAWLGLTYPIKELTYFDARWERYDSDDFDVDNDLFTFHLGHSLMRNVRTALEYTVDADESDNNRFTWILDVNL